MFIDVTTYNNIYNTLGPQSRWYRHVFGKRNYPEISLSLKRLLKIVDEIQPENIHINCYYGDATSWPDLTDLAKIFQQNLFVHTHGTCSPDIIQNLIDNKVNIFFHLDGAYNSTGKVYLGAAWEIIEKNLKLTESHEQTTIEFLVMAHNLDDYQKLKQKENKKIQTTSLNSHRTFILDENGNWLYDVYRTSEKSCKLERSLPSYNELRTMVKSPKGRDILSSPVIPNIKSHYKPTDDFHKRKNLYLCPTGHIFPHYEAMMFMNMLCDDWAFDRINTDYDHEVLYYAQVISKKLDSVITDHPHER